ncbi:hypothetical protein A2U01_0012187 [Trifolium medium]|uniref:Secreted protein n=1 Tax=Trifolium medium TaxID=97028 RepID=A0A392MUV6_9FABA|nr:hypothetical protein [Trifolium medium]
MPLTCLCVFAALLTATATYPASASSATAYAAAASPTTVNNSRPSWWWWCCGMRRTGEHTVTVNLGI